jgi:hypothetical protein
MIPTGDDRTHEIEEIAERVRITKDERIENCSQFDLGQG